MSLGQIISERKSALNNLEKVLKKEAFVNSLKANLNTLTKDVKVGSRFVSTIDYDGNLYECKQTDYTDYITKPSIMNLHDRDGVYTTKIVEEAHRVEPTEIDITGLIENKPVKYIPYSETRFRNIKDAYTGVCMTLTEGACFGSEYLQAKTEIARRMFYTRENDHDKYPTITHIDFQVVSLRLQKSWVDNQDMMRIFATGYFPYFQRQVKRIWVRKCNVVAEAFGKNIDSSSRCINFTLEEMDVKRMLYKEQSKLEKIRKVFSESNPRKSKSKTLQQLTDEQEKMKPALDRVGALIDDLANQNIKVPAYYCQKYGYLIPVKAQIVVDLSGNTFEQELVNKNETAKEEINKQMELKKQAIDEVIPAALHPERVEKEIEKHDSIDKVFGDDQVVVQYYDKNGVLHKGVVNKSVFG